MAGEVIFYTENGKPVFDDKYYEIEKDFVDIDPVTILGDNVTPDDIMDLDPINDLGRL